MLQYTYATLPAFAAFFAVSAAVVAVFLAVYLRVTPYPELALVREGNAAAAVSLGGALLGFALPVANVVRNSHAVADVAAWGVVACAVQLAAYALARAALPRLARDVPAGKMAPAIFLAALSLAVGLLNAACMEG
jgi:putative membrane protein